MAQIDDHYSFVRTFKYSKKDNQNPFNIKYFSSGFDKYNVENAIKINQRSPAQKDKIQNQKKEQNNKEQNNKDIQKKKYRKRIHETELKQIQQLKQFSKVNMKTIKKHYRKKEDNKKEQKQVKNENKGQYPKRQKYKQNKQDFISNLRRIRSKSIEIDNKKEYPRKQNQSRVIRKYDDYLDIQLIQQSRQKGQSKYYKGVIQFNQRIKWFAKIKTTEIDGNFIVQGANRNRCIHEDEIYFQVLQQKGQNTYCKVVCVLHPQNNRQIVGKIGFLTQKKIYYLTPINTRFITMNVRLNQIKQDWLKKINTSYFLAQFHSWEINSQYPECTIIDQYGKFGQIQIQANALLKTHNVYQKEYTEEQIEEGLQKFILNLDQNGEYKIQQEQIKKRTDLRAQRIFTIDPLTARDFDDALSVKKLSQQQRKQRKFETIQKQIYQIGVHIADASFFVQLGSIIDQEAKKRTTSVYLVHKVLPMLPRILCQTMCSLNPGLQRLTLSIWFYIDSEGNILQGQRYDRSVIKSKARFTYQQAQQIIEGKVNKQQQIAKGYGCIDEKQAPQIFQDIKIMNDLAMKLRKKRIFNGSLIFQTPKKCFKLNQNQFPISYQIKCRCQSNFLVQQYMLLANQKVGQVLVKNLRKNALLRKHQFPGEKKIAKFQTFMKKIGQIIKIQKHTRIQQEVNKILQDPTIKLAVKEIITHQMIYLLQMAQYFVVGNSQKQQWIHYALNMPIYTHFTSPIRRYPDIIVHRQLISVIQAEKQHRQIRLQDHQILKNVVERCNKNKTSAKKVSSGCEKIFLCLYLKDNPVFTSAIVSSVQEWGFKINIPKYDIRVIIRMKQLKKVKMIKYQSNPEGITYIFLQYTNKDVTTKIILKQLQEIEVRLGATKQFPIDYAVNICFPHPKQIAGKIILE